MRGQRGGRRQLESAKDAIKSEGIELLRFCLANLGMHGLWRERRDGLRVKGRLLARLLLGDLARAIGARVSFWG